MMKKIDEDKAMKMMAGEMHNCAERSDQLARTRGTRALTVIYQVTDGDHVEASILGGCCSYHTIRALTEAIAVVAGAGMPDEDHHGLDDDEADGHRQFFQ